jgi:hypothetical protein
LRESRTGRNEKIIMTLPWKEKEMKPTTPHPHAFGLLGEKTAPPP